MDPIVEMKNIQKSFAGVRALKGVDFALYPGEIHSLLGQNGAGKSTLMKILTGNYKSDAGEIYINGKKAAIHSVRDASQYGISIVHQELSLLNYMTVAENIFLSRELQKGIFLDDAQMIKLSRELMAELDIEGIDVTQKVEMFPLAKKQLIEIAKAISVRPSVLILDEPTAALTQKETQKLFEVLFTLKDRGIAIVFISHRIDEIMRYCDRGTILVDGRIVSTLLIKESTEKQIIETMLGGEYNKFCRTIKTASTASQPILRAVDIKYKQLVRNVSIDIFPGEICGFTGLLGAGHDTLWRILYGNIIPEKGSLFMKGKPCKIVSPAESIKNGLGLLTDNRKEEGIFSTLPIFDNIALPSYDKFKTSRFFPYLKIQRVKKQCGDLSMSLGLVMNGLSEAIRSLSGGNQQKAILARWLMKEMDIIVLIEPTRGVDVGAKAEIHKLLEQLAAQGKAVVVVSTDASEVRTLSDKIYVMKDGGIKALLEGSPSEDELLSEIMEG